MARIQQMSADGVSAYSIAKALNAEGIRTRYGCEFKQQTVLNILSRSASEYDRCENTKWPIYK